MMNDPAYLRAPTLFAVFQQAAATVAIVTAKDKLRRLLGHGLTMRAGAAASFSAEKANEARLAGHGSQGRLATAGHPLPDVLSTPPSEFVRRAGVRPQDATSPAPT